MEKKPLMVALKKREGEREKNMFSKGTIIL